MAEPDLSKADFAALLDLSEKKFNRWLRKKLLPERDRRLGELKNQRLTFGGRASHAAGINEELLSRKVRKRIGFYAGVAHDSGNPEMLSAQRLAEFRDRIMTSVGLACARMKNDIEMEARAVGNVSEAQLQALLNEQLYAQLRARVFDVVNAELGVLEAEGELAEPPEPVGDTGRKAESAALAPPSTLPKPNGQSRKRGPKPDHEGAARVAEIVARVVPDGDWRPKLDDICDALDQEHIPCPQTWRKRDRTCRNWADYDERANAIKAIEYRLRAANQRKKTIPETLS